MPRGRRPGGRAAGGPRRHAPASPNATPPRPRRHPSGGPDATRPPAPTPPGRCPPHRLRGGPNIPGVHGSFGTVLWVVCVVAAVVAVAALISTRTTWQDFGKNGLLMDSERASDARAPTASADQERDEEIRQMMEARNARRRRRGEAPLDTEREIARLTPPRIDAELRSEIRELVKARNFRRVRAGKAPLDVEAEVLREIEKLHSL